MAIQDVQVVVALLAEVKASLESSCVSVQEERRLLRYMSRSVPHLSV